VNLKEQEVKKKKEIKMKELEEKLKSSSIGDRVCDACGRSL
jgi:hypothetical protein